ncbi:MAG: hypothetical protein QXF06_04120 [Archaeoglobaceae archaeon]
MSELRKELLRKLIHFSGLIYIPAYLFLGKELLVLSLIFVIALLLPIEFLRLKRGYFRFLAREYEEKKLGAYMYFLIAILTVTALFPKDSCFVALITAIVGDGTAGIARKISGKDNLASLTMFLSSTFALALLELLQISALIAVLCGTVVERIRKINGIYLQDNFSVPLLTAIADHSVKYILSSQLKF